MGRGRAGRFTVTRGAPLRVTHKLLVICVGGGLGEPAPAPPFPWYCFATQVDWNNLLRAGEERMLVFPLMR